MYVADAPTWTLVVQTIAWPVAALLIVAAFFLWMGYSTAAQPILKAIFGRIRRVSAFGVEFDLTAKAAMQTRLNVESGFTELRHKLNREFDSHINEEQLNNKLLVVARMAVEPNLITDEAKRSYRCTVHVPDVLFEDALYQLLDYQPTGGGRGRSRSARFGIIGACWRLSHSDIQVDVTTQTTELIKSWAMTTAEAAVVGRDRRSFAAVPLFDTDKQILGVFYVDAAPAGAWAMPQADDAENKLCSEITSWAEEAGLVSSLSRMMREMRRTGPRIKMFE
jgi:hypothetical protein